MKLAAVVITASLTLFFCASSHAELRRLTPAQLEDMREGAATQICSDGGEWLKCFNLAPSRCHEIALSAITPCQPGAVVEERVEQTVEAMLTCIDGRFVEAYGKNRSISPECQKPFPHLQ